MHSGNKETPRVLRVMTKCKIFLLFNLVRKGCLIAILIVIISGCRVWNPSRIYKFNSGELHKMPTDDNVSAYRIRSGDVLSLVLLTNNGYKLVDAGLANTSLGQGLSGSNNILYLVESDGTARFPLIDTVSIAGLTIREASRYLETKYSEHLVGPWVQLGVRNRRAFVYRAGEQASVVNLNYEGMTLLEVIAASGGIPPTGKAYRVKLIRTTEEVPAIYSIDLRDGANLGAGEIIIRPNDTIIIDPTFETTFVTQLTPLLAIVTSGIAIYGLFRTLR